MNASDFATRNCLTIFGRSSYDRQFYNQCRSVFFQAVYISFYETMGLGLRYG